MALSCEGVDFVTRRRSSSKRRLSSEWIELCSRIRFQNNKKKWSAKNRNVSQNHAKKVERYHKMLETATAKDKLKAKRARRKMKKVKIPPPAPRPNRLSRSQAALQLSFLAAHLGMMTKDLRSILPTNGIAIQQVCQDQLEVIGSEMDRGNLDAVMCKWRGYRQVCARSRES